MESIPFRDKSSLIERSLFWEWRLSQTLSNHWLIFSSFPIVFLCTIWISSSRQRMFWEERNLTTDQPSNSRKDYGGYSLFLLVIYTLQYLKEYTFIWKFDGDLDNIPSNLHLVDWLPQPQLLRQLCFYLFMVCRTLAAEKLEFDDILLLSRLYLV